MDVKNKLFGFLAGSVLYGVTATANATFMATSLFHLASPTTGNCLVQCIHEQLLSQSRRRLCTPNSRPPDALLLAPRSSLIDKAASIRFGEDSFGLVVPLLRMVVVLRLEPQC